MSEPCGNLKMLHLCRIPHFLQGVWCTLCCWFPLLNQTEGSPSCIAHFALPCLPPRDLLEFLPNACSPDRGLIHHFFYHPVFPCDRLILFYISCHEDIQV